MARLVGGPPAVAETACGSTRIREGGNLQEVMTMRLCHSAGRLEFRLLSALVAGLLPGGCGLGEVDNYAPLTVFDNFHVIAPGQAYRSAQLDAESLRLAIETYGIRTIVNLRGENEEAEWYRNERAVAQATGVTLVNIPMSAGELPPRDTLLLLYDTFVTAEHPLLIHCQAGADRTGAAAAIWRMVVLGEPRELARQELTAIHGHFAARHPEMDELVRIFQPDREWIAHEYTPE